jgi:hypothetical protein
MKKTEGSIERNKKGEKIKKRKKQKNIFFELKKIRS